MDIIKRYFGFILVLGIIFITAGCGGGGGTSGGGNTSAVPSIKNISIPNASSSDGGNLAIQATITCKNTIVGVYAEIISNSTGESVTLSNNIGSSIYKGTYSAPENVDLVAQVYSMTITAIDSKGNTTVSAPVIFQVPASGLPPGPPEDPV